MARLAAWQVLRSGSQTPMRLVDQAAKEHELDGRDRGLLRRLVGTAVRRRGTLQAVVRTFARGKPSPDLTAHLHLGLIQLLFLDRIPDHAAVSSTLEAVTHSLGRSKVPYVNAVLRTVIRSRRPGSLGDPTRDIVGRAWHLDRPIFRDREEHPLLWAEDALSMPAQILRRWRKRLGLERAFELAELALDEPDLSLRVVGGTRADVEEELREAELTLTPTEHPSMWLVPAGQADVALATEAFRAGRVTVQGEASLRAAELMEARPGEKIADLCAAPGGKTAVLLEAGAEVLACDVERTRLERLRETIARLGLEQRLSVRQSDATEPAGDERFDGVLVDAPCSNTGVMAARPGARWRFGPKTLASLTKLQERLLLHAAERVRPGGRLVWSTCSLEPEENKKRIEAFLARGDAWTLEEELELQPAAPPGPIDGSYAARLRRRA